MTTWTCRTCGKELDSQVAARGHYKFSGGEHGERMELPEDWADHVAEPAAGDAAGDAAADDAADAAAGGGDDAADGRTDPDGQTDRESDPDLAGRLRRALFGDVRELWR